MKDKEINKMISDMNASSKQERKKQKQQEKEKRLKWLQGSSLEIGPNGEQISSDKAREKINNKSRKIKMLGFISCFALPIVLLLIFAYVTYNSANEVVNTLAIKLSIKQGDFNTAYKFIAQAFKIMFIYVPVVISVISITLYSINYFNTKPLLEFIGVNRVKVTLASILAALAVLYLICAILVCASSGVFTAIYYNIYGRFNENVFMLLKDSTSGMYLGLIGFTLCHAAMVVLPLVSSKYYEFVKKEKIRCTTFDSIFEHLYDV